ncbi:MAG: tRNA (guanosine(46)-N7)-methyltransferase TrmB [Magnetococcales bacterium]|nr:tRNA (guanosine(46)-N7)-methyltransferase TrmB [Magnetococcales bacterium]
MCQPREPQSPSPWQSFKVHGRKRGFLTLREKSWLDETLPGLRIPAATERAALLDALVATPDARLILEIGFGNGQFLSTLAARHPNDRFLGAEVFQEGEAALIKRLNREGIGNVRLLPCAAQSALASDIPPASLDWVIINFPDPWPKKRHHKRRIVQHDFLELLAGRMRPGGLLTLATDWEEYAFWMDQTLNGHPAFVNLAPPPDRFVPQPDFWVATRFQTKGEAAGRPIFHLAWRRIGSLAP